MEWLKLSAEDKAKFNFKLEPESTVQNDSETQLKVAFGENQN